MRKILRKVYKKIRRTWHLLRKHYMWLVLGIFPLVVGWIYTLEHPCVIAVEAGELLSYYATAFGILSSFTLYRQEKKDEKRERNRDIRPHFNVFITPSKEEQLLFQVEIEDVSQKPIKDIVVYDELPLRNGEKNYCLRVLFCSIRENIPDIEYDYNFTEDKDILDTDGYPRYLQISCADVDGQTWECIFNKCKMNNQPVYYPEAPYIV